MVLCRSVARAVPTFGGRHVVRSSAAHGGRWECERVHVTLVIYSLRGGGAERVMSIMANHWAERGWKVTLLTYDDGAEAPAYRLSAAVDHRCLDIEGASSGVMQAVRSNVRRLVVLRRAIKDSAPDVVVSFLDVVNVRSILATFGLGVPVVVSEHSDPSRHRIGAVWQALRKWSYRYAASVVVLTPDALGYFPNAIRRKGAVIPNPLEVDVGADLVPVGGRRKTVVSVGRLAEEKGFDRLITAFSMVAAKHREWSLTIWGEGEGRQSLEAVRDRLGLRGRVALPGWTREPFKELSVAGLFVMSSRYEGFSNALCEAMACGAPVVSFDCQGPRHIVRDGHDGVLVPEGDVDKLAAAMDRLMADPAERDRLAANGVQVDRALPEGQGDVLMGTTGGVVRGRWKMKPIAARNQSVAGPALPVAGSSPGQVTHVALARLALRPHRTCGSPPMAVRRIPSTVSIRALSDRERLSPSATGVDCAAVSAALHG